MRWIVAVLGLVLTGAVQAGFSPRYPTDLPCASDTRPIEHFELTARSTADFLTISAKEPCRTDVMLETLYVYGGHEVPDTASMFDARINPPHNTLADTQVAYERNRTDLNAGLELGRDLLRAHKIDDAIAVLQPLADSHNSLDPKSGELIGVLANAYELNGQTAEALHWAKIAYSLTPTPSTWLHVQVLRAQSEHGGGWFQSHSVLNLPFRETGFVASNIVLTIDGRAASLRETIDMLAQFLYQRVELHPKNDAVTASLLFDLGYLVGLNGGFENAQYILNLSAMYGDRDASQASTYFQWKEWTSHTLDWLLSAVYGGLLLAAWGLYAWMFRILLRLCSGLQERAGRWTATVVAGGVLACIGFIFLLGFVAFVLSFSTGQALNVFEGVTFAFIAGCVVVGWGVVWSKILRAEIRPVALWHWLAWIGLFAWFAGLMYFSLMNAMSPKGAQLMTNELMPVLLVLPVVGLFGLWVRKIRQNKQSVARN